MKHSNNQVSLSNYLPFPNPILIQNLLDAVELEAEVFEFVAVGADGILVAAEFLDQAKGIEIEVLVVIEVHGLAVELKGQVMVNHLLENAAELGFVCL